MGKIYSRIASFSRPPKEGTWEEQLYKSVTKQQWKQLSESNDNRIHLHPNVARWNDAAAKEAFHDAKAQFSARIRNVPCDVPPPDHEFYLDKVDWSKFEDDVIPEMDEMSGAWDGEGGVEGLEVMLDSSFGVGWGPEEWYDTKKKEKEAKKGEVRKTRAVKAAAAGGEGGGGGKLRGCGYGNKAIRNYYSTLLKEKPRWRI